MFGIGITEFMLIMIVALLVVGPDKLPGIARSLAKTYNELRRAGNEIKKSVRELNLDSAEDFIRGTVDKVVPSTPETDLPGKGSGAVSSRNVSLNEKAEEGSSADGTKEAADGAEQVDARADSSEPAAAPLAGRQKETTSKKSVSQKTASKKTTSKKSVKAKDEPVIEPVDFKGPARASKPSPCSETAVASTTGSIEPVATSVELSLESNDKESAGAVKRGTKAAPAVKAAAPGKAKRGLKKTASTSTKKGGAKKRTVKAIGSAKEKADT